MCNARASVRVDDARLTSVRAIRSARLLATSPEAWIIFEISNDRVLSSMPSSVSRWTRSAASVGIDVMSVTCSAISARMTWPVGERRSSSRSARDMSAACCIQACSSRRCRSASILPAVISAHGASASEYRLSSCSIVGT